jgi:hypothetical protein
VVAIPFLVAACRTFSIRVKNALLRFCAEEFGSAVFSPPISSSLHAMKQKGIIQNKKRRSNFTFFISLDFSV